MRLGAPNLARMWRKKDVQGLIDVLASRKHLKLRAGAIHLLGELGDARAVELLVSVLDDDDAEVRGRAAEALAKIGDARAADGLAAVVDDQDPDVRCKAALALARLGDTRAVRPLLAVASTRVGDLSEGQKGWFPASEARAAIDRLGSPAIVPLAAALADDDPRVRHQAIFVLAHWGTTPMHREDRRAVADALIAALGDEDADVRWQAAQSLGSQGDPRAVGPLMSVLHDDDVLVVDAVAQALGELGDARAVEPLVTVLAARDRKVRRTAASALEALGWQPEDDTRRALVEIADERWDSVRSLGSAAVEPLVAALWVSDRTVRREAATVLSGLGWEPRDDTEDALLAVATGDWEHVAELGARAAEPLSTLFLEHPSWSRSVPSAHPPWQAAHALARLGDRRALAPLMDQVEEACHAAARWRREAEDIAEMMAQTPGFYDWTHMTWEGRWRWEGVEFRWPAEAAAAAERSAERAARDLALLGASGLEAIATLRENPDKAVSQFATSWLNQLHASELSPR
jgi:HEAT repeat protein